jgi:O-antigen/teichoic acid export membrane protein
MTGNVFAQLVAIGTIPILTRLYSPENFGLFALFVAIVNISDKFTTLSYERAIVLPKDRNDGLSILILCLIILIFFFLIILLVTVGAKDILISLLKNGTINKWLWLIPFVILLTGCIKIFRYWLLREENFYIISLSRGGEATSAAVFKICFALLIGTSATGLIGGLVIGLLFSILLTFSKISVREIYEHCRSLTKTSILKIAASYRKFPLFATWNAVLKIVSIQLVVMMFTIYYSSAVVGFYSLGSRVLMQPMLFFSQSIQNAYFQKAASDLNHGKIILHSFFHLTGFLAVSGLLPFTILYFLSVPLFSFIFGQEWVTAGIYVKWMSPWFFLLFIGTPSNVVYEVMYKQDIKSFLNMTSLALCFCAIYYGHKMYGDALTTLKLFAAANIILELISIAIACIVVFQHRTVKLI